MGNQAVYRYVASLFVLAAALVAVPAAGAEPTYTSTFTAHAELLQHVPESLETGIAAGPDGAVWVTEPEEPAFARIAPDLTIAEFGEPDGLEAPNEPQAIATGSDGGLWFTEPNQNAIGRFDPTTEEVELIEPGTHGLSAAAEPEQIVAGADGNLWFTELNKHAIGKVVPAHGTTETQVTEYTSGLTGNTLGITAASDGLWFTEVTPGGGTIGKISTAGAVGPTYGGVLPTSNTEAPTYVTAGPDGNLWFVDGYFKGYVGRMTKAGEKTTFTAGIDANSSETAPVVGSDGNLWLLEANRAKLLQVTPAGAVTSYQPPEHHLFEGLRGPMTLGPDGNLWEVSGGGEVVKIALSGATPPAPEGKGTGTPPPSGPLPSPPAKPLKCKKGFRKKSVHGKARCVKVKPKRHKKHGHH